MSDGELIEELTEICIKQAEIIREQAYLLEQFGAESLEEEELSDRLERCRKF